MAKRPPAIYEPGELDRVRQNLGDIDREEARRLASLLGGDVGVEKRNAPRPAARHETVEVTVGGRASPPSAQRWKNETQEMGSRERERERERSQKRATSEVPDEATTPSKATYRERLRMDRYAA